MQTQSDVGPRERTAAILLVEEDDGTRRSLFWSLYVDGFKVLTARSVADAHRLSRDVPGPIQILLLGSLPKGSDAQLLRQQLEHERPELQTVVMADLAPMIEAGRSGGGTHAFGGKSEISPATILDRINLLLRKKSS